MTCASCQSGVGCSCPWYLLELNTPVNQWLTWWLHISLWQLLTTRRHSSGVSRCLFLSFRPTCSHSGVVATGLRKHHIGNPSSLPHLPSLICHEHVLKTLDTLRTCTVHHVIWVHYYYYYYYRYLLPIYSADLHSSSAMLKRLSIQRCRCWYTNLEQSSRPWYMCRNCYQLPQHICLNSPSTAIDPSSGFD